MSDLPFFTPPPPQTHAIVTFPRPSILLVRLNRPKSLNCMDKATNYELDALFSWLDAEPSLYCAIITGTGRAFSVGYDLKEWSLSTENIKDAGLPPSGFGGLSRREGKKPVIVAVNGLAYGGGCEIVINSDIVIAAENATFSLPEGRRGVLAAGGGLSRLIKTVGKQRAMEFALTGRVASAREMEAWGLINFVVPAASTTDSGEEITPVLSKALEVAESLVESSPDSLIVTRKGVLLGWDSLSADEGTTVLQHTWYPKLNKGENMAEGLKAFVEKRKPNWVPSKL